MKAVISTALFISMIVGAMVYAQQFPAISESKRIFLALQESEEKYRHLVENANDAVFITQGAKWGSEFDPNDVVRAPFGTGTFSFGTCTTGNVAILPNQDFQNAGFTNMSYDLSRLLEAGVSCPTFDNTSGMAVASQ